MGELRRRADAARARIGAVALAAALAFLLGSAAGLGGCAHDGGGRDGRAAQTHVVEPGENLYRIALRYGLSVDDLMRANQIDDPTTLEVGRALRIPGDSERRQGLARSSAGNACAPPSELRRTTQARAVDESDVTFGWPLRGRLTTCFGERHSRPHEGIDIAIPEGTPVRAAEAGKVIFAGSMGAYGRVVILKHEGSYASVYAHNSENLVEKSAFVEKGALIAESGATGNATGPHLHFEIRRLDRPDDPMLYLP